MGHPQDVLARIQVLEGHGAVFTSHKLPDELLRHRVQHSHSGSAEVGTYSFGTTVGRKLIPHVNRQAACTLAHRLYAEGQRQAAAVGRRYIQVASGDAVRLHIGRGSHLQHSRGTLTRLQRCHALRRGRCEPLQVA